MESEEKNIAVESHPWPPFVPPRARVLIMGTFPPKPCRWSMDFYYPNKINDFWRVVGIVFFDNPGRFWDDERKCFRLDDIKDFLTERGIALNDTGAKIRRLRDNASDKYLEIVEPVNLSALLRQMPECHTLVTTGEKAAATLAAIVGVEAPATGCCVSAEYEGRHLAIWRMPSTSRAYPMPVARKAQEYARMFASVGLL